MITDWLFDTPWWALVALIAVGTVIFLAGNRRQDRRIMSMGGALMFVGATLCLTSYFVDTDREKAEKRVRGIAAAVDQRDWNALHALLDPGTTLRSYLNRDQIVSGGQVTVERIGVKNVRLIRLESSQTDTLITVDVDVLSEQDRFPVGATPTSWRFTFEDLGTGWNLARIEPLPNRIITAEMIGGQLDAPR